ncbi:MAG: hypothetical protein ACYDHP_09885 [Ferrimicrobium sp.]
MSGLEHLRCLAGTIGASGVEVALEAAWVLASYPIGDRDMVVGVERLLASTPGNVELWVVANRILGSLFPDEEAPVVVAEFLAHLASCELHASHDELVAVSRTRIIHLGDQLPSVVSTCSWMVLPDQVADLIAAVRGVVARVVPASYPRLVDGRRMGLSRWPELCGALAPSLVALQVRWEVA